MIETMSDLAEALPALAAARETGLPVVACMTFDTGPQKDRTMMGVTPEQAAERLTAAGADVVGTNCGHGIAGLVEVARRMHAATDRPIWIKANAGLPEVIEGNVVYRQTPAEFAALVPRLVESGRRRSAAVAARRPSSSGRWRTRSDDCSRQSGQGRKITPLAKSFITIVANATG